MISVISTLDLTRDRFMYDVIDGLSRPWKRLPPKYFYDEAGSRLFDRITGLDEYYLTRSELAIMDSRATEIAAHCGPRTLLIEPGAGNLTKVRRLLNHLPEPAGYVPIDVSSECLRNAAWRLARDFPRLRIVPVVRDFSESLELPKIPANHRVVYFPGSTIGNFEPDETDDLLDHFAQLVGPGGGLILGADLRKAPAILEPAYNDASGVTAAFNRNLLVRINRELGADFDVTAFRHLAFYNIERSRIEMHLVSVREQDVHIADRQFSFRTGESIRTEHSYKFEVAELARRALACGFRLECAWTDTHGYFAVAYFVASKD